MSLRSFFNISRKKEARSRGSGLLFESLFSLVDGNFGHFVVFLNFVDNFNIFNDSTKNGVNAIEMRRWAVADKKLASTSVGSSVSHREGASQVFVLIDLTIDFVSWPTCAAAVRATTLNHKIVDYTVEGEAIVVIVLDELFEVCDGIGSVGFEKFEYHCSVFRFNRSFFHNFVLSNLARLSRYCSSSTQNQQRRAKAKF